MASLRQIISECAPLVLIDAASARIQVGVLGQPGGGRWAISDAEAGIGIFQCLSALATDLSQVAAFAFCSGPGSILGIRTAAMALRTWTFLKPRPIYAYSSLELVRAGLASPDVSVIADARRGMWHVVSAGHALRRLPIAELPQNLIMPEGFRHWSPLPANLQTTSYNLETLLAGVNGADLFHPRENPDAFLHEEPAYKTWTPQIHRAP